MNPIFAVVGVLLLVYGAWLAWPPLGFVMAGILFLKAAANDQRQNDKGANRDN